MMNNGEEIYNFVAQEKEHFKYEKLEPKFLIINERKVRYIIEHGDGYELAEDRDYFLGLEIVRSLNNVVEIGY